MDERDWLEGDEDYDASNDREPRKPKVPNLQGGAMLPVPERREYSQIEELEFSCV